MNITVKVSASMLPKEQILANLGLKARGEVQSFYTERALFRMRRYMPWKTGLTATSLTQVTSPVSITVSAPYAPRLYFGVGPNGKPLSYTRTVNPLAGPYWDKTMAQAEGKALIEETGIFARSLCND